MKRFFKNGVREILALISYFLSVCQADKVIRSVICSQQDNCFTVYLLTFPDLYINTFSQFYTDSLHHFAQSKLRIQIRIHFRVSAQPGFFSHLLYNFKQIIGITFILDFIIICPECIHTCLQFGLFQDITLLLKFQIFRALYSPEAL